MSLLMFEATALNQVRCEASGYQTIDGQTYNYGFDTGTNRGGIIAIWSFLGRTVATVPTLCFFNHLCTLCRCNQGFDVLDSPHGAATKFHWLGKAPGSDAIPPAGFFYWDDWGDWWLRFRIANDVWQPEKSGFGEVVHVQPSFFYEL